MDTHVTNSETFEFLHFREKHNSWLPDDEEQETQIFISWNEKKNDTFETQHAEMRKASANKLQMHIEKDVPEA